MKTVGVGGDDADSVSNSSFQTHRNMDIPVLRNLRLNPSGHWHGTSPNERCLMAWPDYPTKIAMRYLNFALFFFLITPTFVVGQDGTPLSTYAPAIHAKPVVAPVPINRNSELQPEPRGESGQLHYAVPPQSPSDRRSYETIELAWKISLRANASVQARRQSVLAAEHGIHSAHSERLPSLQLMGGALLSDGERSIRTTSPTGQELLIPYQPQGQVAAGLIGNVPLYQGGKVSAMVAAAQNRRNAESQSAKAFEQDLQLTVARDFLYVLQTEAELRAANSGGESALEMARNARWQLEAGQIDQADFLQQQAALAQAEYQIRLAEISVRQARMVYNQRLGRDPNFPCQLETPELPPRTQDVNQLTTLALQQRPELRGILFESRSLEAQSESRKSSMRPQIHVGGGMLSDTNQFQTPNDLAVGYLTVTWKLYDAGRNQHRVEDLKHQAASKRFEHQQLLDDIRIRIWQAFHQLEAAWAYLTAEEASAAAQAEIYHRAEQLFEQHQITMAQKLQQKQALDESELRLTKARLYILERDFIVKREAHLLR